MTFSLRLSLLIGFASVACASYGPVPDGDSPSVQYPATPSVPATPIPNSYSAPLPPVLVNPIPTYAPAVAIALSKATARNNQDYPDSCDEEPPYSDVLDKEQNQYGESEPELCDEDEQPPYSDVMGRKHRQKGRKYRELGPCDPDCEDDHGSSQASASASSGSNIDGSPLASVASNSTDAAQDSTPDSDTSSEPASEPATPPSEQSKDPNNGVDKTSTTNVILMGLLATLLF